MIEEKVTGVSAPETTKSMTDNDVDDDITIDSAKDAEVLAYIEKGWTPDDLINLWKSTFEIYSFNNPEYNITSLHYVLGQVLKQHRIHKQGVLTDPRIHILYLKPTFSGGSAGNDLIAKIFSELGLKHNTILDSSDAALIGSLQQETEEDEDGNKTKKYVNVKGLLDKSVTDSLVYDEAGWLFNRNLTPYQEKVRNMLQMALNLIESESSKLRRPLKHGTIECEAECSLLLVTYPPENLTTEILNSGLTQRFFTIPKSIDLDGRIQNMETDISRYGKSDINVTENIEKIVKILNDIKEHYSNFNAFFFTEDTLKYWNERSKEISTKFKSANLMIQDNIGSIMSASVRKIAAISMHHAAMRFTNIIEIEDVQYAFDQIFVPILELTHSYFELRLEYKVSTAIQNAEINKIKHKCTNTKEGTIRKDISKKKFLEILGKTLDITSTKSIYKYFNSFLSRNLISEIDGKINFTK